ncbi:MAG: hypothetical protein R2867_24215 [Caldilineaceae bacterium]
MSIEPIFLITLLLATLLCTLIAGFILIFAIVVMPALGHCTIVNSYTPFRSSIG